MFYRNVAEYYNGLSYIIQLVNLLKFGDRYAGFTMHKSLERGEGEKGAKSKKHSSTIINEIALEKANLPESPSVLDAGCGFGGTIFDWYDKIGGTYDGLTLSRFQWEIAEREAKKRGIADRCRFYLKSYDDVITDRYDAIIAIESLIHSPDLESTVKNLSKALKKGGKFILVEDILKNLSDEKSLEALKKYWHLNKIHTYKDFLKLFGKNGFVLRENLDLSGSFKTRNYASLKIMRNINILLHGLLPGKFLKALFASNAAGESLQLLHKRGDISYRLLVFEKEFS